MTANRVHLAAVWNSRQETTGDLASGLLATLDAVTGICPYCEEWNVQDYSRPGYGLMKMGVHEVPLSAVRGRLEEYVRHGVCRDDDGEPDPGGGYSLNVFNKYHFASSRRVSIRCHGAYPIANWRPSGAAFDTSYDANPDLELTRYSVIHALAAAFISIWRPHYLIATVDDLRSYRSDPPDRFELEWMIYLSAPLARRVLPPPNVGVEWGRDGSVLLIAADATFDVTNQDHMAAARAIKEAMAPLNRRFPRL